MCLTKQYKAYWPHLIIRHGLRVRFHITVVDFEEQFILKDKREKVNTQPLDIPYGI